MLEKVMTDEVSSTPDEAQADVQAQPQIDGDSIDLDAEFKNTHIQEVLDKLDRELIGLKPIKTRIRETAALLLVDRVRKNCNSVQRRPPCI